jgi:hypothetical protein
MTRDVCAEDRESGRLVTVLLNPAAGERRYVAGGGSLLLLKQPFGLLK